MPAKPYNGHPSYNHWNAALWFANDEGLYRMALECKTGKDLLARCDDIGFFKTPDGVRLNERLCGHALRCLRS